MFGGATSYVDTLDRILAFVRADTPTTDDLVEWHREQFARVSSRDSIMRRIRYLDQVGFLAQRGEQWTLGDAGRRYVKHDDIATLLEIMCARNVGLRSLLYALSAGPMGIEAISDQQLDTHPELGWTRGETDMAKQRTNWLRSMGLVEKRDGAFASTEAGREFVESAVEAWADTEPTSEQSDQFSADTYRTTTYARAVDPEFRATVLSRYDETCPVSGVDHPGLLDVAHVLPWREYPDVRADLSNVLPLSKTHHAAFDRELFTIDPEYHIRVNPDFETDSDLLKRTIRDRAGESLSLPSEAIDPEYLRKYNQSLEWV
jgi:putative restriction endonuclease